MVCAPLTSVESASPCYRDLRWAGPELHEEYKNSPQPEIPCLPCSLEKGKENHHKNKDFLSQPNPWNPWKRREKRSRKTRKSSQGKKQGVPRKQGFWNREKVPQKYHEKCPELAVLAFRRCFSGVLGAFSSGSRKRGHRNGVTTVASNFSHFFHFFSPVFFHFFLFAVFFLFRISFFFHFFRFISRKKNGETLFARPLLRNPDLFLVGPECRVGGDFVAVFFSAAPQQSEICVKFSVFHTVFDVKFWWIFPSHTQTLENVARKISPKFHAKFHESRHWQRKTEKIYTSALLQGSCSDIFLLESWSPLPCFFPQKNVG